MNVTVKQMQAFVAVARCQSFAEACELVHLSQPALSIAIRKLEDAVGGRLFARSTRSVTLTPEGEAFYPVARRLLSDWDQALDDVHNLFALRRGKLDVAAMPTFTSSLLPGLLKRFHGDYPDINVTVHDVVAEQVVDMVREGRAELGVTFDPGEASDLEFHPLFTDRLVAVLPRDHPLLALERGLRWRDLQDHSYITLQRPSSVRLLIDGMLRDKGIVLNPAFEAHQLVSVGRMVTENLGVSVVPSLSESQMLEMGAEVRPVGAPAVTREVGVITRRRYPLSVAAQAMFDILVQCGAPESPR
ncbi:LysR family transcriptional regulator [Halioglobus sp. HI00S01]|uniref:LysR family transcriptional regulator n=1 Tax=Halioglobus sp. HI00S01 TaxID=1822214 RepID=UPI0007C3DA23|nr:LysR family transcriptional regulator [Halioglobus sp. HI00S01]KZX56776.1 LysR family transcriptional regulator [Halioglobus sp. HI00S01]